MGNKKLVALGLLLSAALILSYIESLFPFFFGIPGMKLGLGNLAVLLALYSFKAREAFLLNAARVGVTGFLFGNLYTLLYSMAGALCSFLIMLLLQKSGRFSMTGTSIGGGVFHNIGQMIMAMAVVRTTGVLYYLPLLLIAGLITGALNGILGTLVRPYIRMEGME